MNRHHAFVRWAWTCVAMAALSACSTFGVPTPQGFNERVAAGLASVTAVRETALALLNAGQITAVDARNVQEQADSAREAIDIARTLKGVDFKRAEQRLEATSRILAALQTYLNSRRGGAS